MKKKHAEIMPDLLDLKGAQVLDVGCGDGSIARLMAKSGAHVLGIEPNPAQLEKARETPSVAGERYKEGIAQKLPVDDGRADIVVFFNSLHHIPVGHMDDALREAARAVKTGGLIYIAEPVAEGEHFELMQPVHDETEVRAAALEAIYRCENFGLTQEKELTYVHPVLIPNFAAFRERMLRINPHRAAEFDEKEPELTARYERLGTTLEGPDGGKEFDQPMRVNMLRKA